MTKTFTVVVEETIEHIIEVEAESRLDVFMLSENKLRQLVSGLKGITIGAQIFSVSPKQDQTEKSEG
jgi:hypothetical protein